MATLIIELSDEVLAQLQTDAMQQGKAAEVVAQELIAQQLEAKQVSQIPDSATANEQATETPQSEVKLAEYRAERERVRNILKEAGLLAELDPELVKRADPTVSIEKVRESLSRGGKPMSEIAIEQRGPLY